MLTITEAAAQLNKNLTPKTHRILEFCQIKALRVGLPVRIRWFKEWDGLATLDTVAEVLMKMDINVTDIQGLRGGDMELTLEWVM